MRVMTRMCISYYNLTGLLPINSGVRQHALLNLVRMHYLRNEWPAARKVSFCNGIVYHFVNNIAIVSSYSRRLL